MARRLCFISLVHVGYLFSCSWVGGASILVWHHLVRAAHACPAAKIWSGVQRLGFQVPAGASTIVLAPSRAACPLGKRQRGPTTGAPWNQVQTAVLAWFSTGEISRFARTINRETILQVSLVLNSPDSATIQLQKQQLVAPFFDSCTKLNPSSSFCVLLSAICLPTCLPCDRCNKASPSPALDVSFVTRSFRPLIYRQTSQASDVLFAYFGFSNPNLDAS